MKEIRRAIIEADLVECMVALPGQLFTNTQIPACIWLLTKDKSGGNGKAHRKGEVLFIDARQIGFMKDRVLRDFSTDDIKRLPILSTPGRRIRIMKMRLVFVLLPHWTI